MLPVTDSYVTVYEITEPILKTMTTTFSPKDPTSLNDAANDNADDDDDRRAGESSVGQRLRSNSTRPTRSWRQELSIRLLLPTNRLLKDRR